MVYGHPLPNDRHQQPSLLYQRLKDSIRRITIWIKVSRGLTIIRALALDNLAVVVVVSHFQCFNRRVLAGLPWRDILYLVQSVMSHSGCLRYGHFSANDIKRTDISRPPLAHGWRLISHWGKYEDLSEIFFYDMPTAAAGKYHLMRPERALPTTVTAAMIISWYIRVRDERYPDHPLLFPGMPPLSRRKTIYTTWLRNTITAAIPVFPAKFLRKVRPHGWRAGWVCDRRKDGTPDGTTMREGRWSSKQAMGLYARTAFSVVCPVSTILYRQRQAQPAQLLRRR